MGDISFVDWRHGEIFEATNLSHFKAYTTVKPFQYHFQHDIWKPIRRKPLKISQSQACRMLNGSKTQPNHGDCCEDTDLDTMVKDFIENAISVPRIGVCDTDSQSFNNHIDKLQETMAPTAREKYIHHMVKSAISCIDEEKIDTSTISCKGICIRLEIAKGLKRLGLDANVCKSKWLQDEKLPAGEYHYIEVLHNGDEVFIVDTDFRCQFEIARPIALYEKILNIIPSVFVGKPERLNQILEIMSIAASFSLKKNSLHVPPWRTLEYMHAKWFSPKTKVVSSYDNASLTRHGHFGGNHECKAHLHDLKMQMLLQTSAIPRGSFM